MSERRRGQGIVVDIGSDVKADFNIDDYVLYTEWAADVIEYADGGVIYTYHSLDAEDILATIDSPIDDLGMSKPEQSMKWFKTILQPFRHGNLSKEFVESYPQQVKYMLNNKQISHDEVRNAKYVYKDIAGWREWKRGKTK